MLKGGELLSAAFNLFIAAYLIYFYPRGVRRQFQNRPTPPLFQILAKAIPVTGYLLAAGTLIYVILRLSGTIT